MHPVSESFYFQLHFRARDLVLCYMDSAGGGGGGRGGLVGLARGTSVEGGPRNVSGCFQNQHEVGFVEGFNRSVLIEGRSDL